MIFLQKNPWVLSEPDFRVWLALVIKKSFTSKTKPSENSVVTEPTMLIYPDIRWCYSFKWGEWCWITQNVTLPFRVWVTSNTGLFHSLLRFLVEFNLCSCWHSDMTAKGKEQLSLFPLLRVMNPGFTSYFSPGMCSHKTTQVQWWFLLSVSRRHPCWGQCCSVWQEIPQLMLNVHFDLFP